MSTPPFRFSANTFQWYVGRPLVGLMFTTAMGALVGVPSVVLCDSSSAQHVDKIPSLQISSALPSSPSTRSPKCGEWVEGLPVFLAREVQQHSSRRNRVWVTYREGVYDVTEFLDLHPGGPEKLMLSAGRDVEGYWKSFPQHFEGAVGEILERYRIGNIVPASGGRFKPTSTSGGPLAWMSSMVWGDDQPKANEAVVKVQPLKTHHESEWDAWKRAMEGGRGNLCTKEGVDNPVDAHLTAKWTAEQEARQRLEAKRAQFSALEKERNNLKPPQ